MGNVNITVKIDRKGRAKDETYTWANQTYGYLVTMQQALSIMIAGLANYGSLVNASLVPKQVGNKNESLRLSMTVTHAEDGSKHSHVEVGYDNIAEDGVLPVIDAAHQALGPFLATATRT